MDRKEALEVGAALSGLGEPDTMTKEGTVKTAQLECPVCDYWKLDVVETDDRQEWYTDSYRCPRCGGEFKRTGAHKQKGTSHTTTEDWDKDYEYDERWEDPEFEAAHSLLKKASINKEDTNMDRKKAGKIGRKLSKLSADTHEAQDFPEGVPIGDEFEDEPVEMDETLTPHVFTFNITFSLVATPAEQDMVTATIQQITSMMTELGAAEIEVEGGARPL